jgi:hypothetical protein
MNPFYYPYWAEMGDGERNKKQKTPIEVIYWG